MREQGSRGERDRGLGRSVKMALGGLALYGGWAFLANQSHGLTAAIRAFVAQGFLSFASTFYLTLLMEAMLRRGGSPSLRLLRSFLASTASMFVLNIGIHWLNGTSELLTTVAPVLTLGTVYCALYTAFALGRVDPGPAEATEGPSS